MIEAYVAELARALTGPRRLTADLLAEARDALVDAAEAYERGGLPTAEAQARAVADFGPVSELAPEYQRVLAASQSRRTAVLIGLVLAPQHLVWAIAGRVASVDPTWVPGPGYAGLSSLIEILGGVGLLLALLIVALRGAVLRQGTAARLTGTLAAVVAITFASAGLALTLLGPVPALSLMGLPWATAFLLVPLAGVAWSGRRCFRAAG